MSTHTRGRPGTGGEGGNRVLVTQRTQSHFGRRRNEPLTRVSAVQGLFVLVGDTGFEPVTSSVSSILDPSATVPGRPSEHEASPPMCACIHPDMLPLSSS